MTRRGFTLIEVLIAIALMLMLGGAMFGFLQDLLTTRGRTLERSGRQRAASTLIERLENDVAACLVGDARSGAGVRGDGSSLRLLTRGVMPQVAARGINDPAALGDLQVVEYRFDAAQQRLEARKAPATESAAFAPLGGSIAHVRFRYLDGRRWRDDYDSLGLNRLPSAIEVAVWFNPWPSDEVSSAAAAADERSPLDEEAAGLPAFDREPDVDVNAAIDAPNPPPPDRMRVIVIPDAGAAQPDEGGDS